MCCACEPCLTQIPAPSHSQMRSTWRTTRMRRAGRRSPRRDDMTVSQIWRRNTQTHAPFARPVSLPPRHYKPCSHAGQHPQPWVRGPCRLGTSSLCQRTLRRSASPSSWRACRPARRLWWHASRLGTPSLCTTPRRGYSTACLRLSEMVATSWTRTPSAAATRPRSASPWRSSARTSPWRRCATCCP